MVSWAAAGSTFGSIAFAFHGDVVGGVDDPVEDAFGHGAALERRRTQGAELGPPGTRAREARDADDRALELLAA